VTQEDKPAGKGELRRRWRQILDDGSVAALRSEGRLAAIYVLYVADWTSCEVRCSMRQAARMLGVHPTTIRRGFAQLIAAGILEKSAGQIDGQKAIFVVLGRAQPVSTPDTSGAHHRTHTVRAPDTTRAQAGHEPCAARARPVRSPRTLCARNTVLPIGSQSRTNGVSSVADLGGGVEPPPARPGEEEGMETTA
jgi:hypothetical protein